MSGTVVLSSKCPSSAPVPVVAAGIQQQVSAFHPAVPVMAIGVPQEVSAFRPFFLVAATGIQQQVPNLD